MTARIICLIIGYICGNFMTAEIVTRRITGKPCSELGTTGNPGMANVMANLGFKPGIIVLAGDLGKTCFAALLSWLLCGMSLHGTDLSVLGMPGIGRIAILYAGLGTTLGHNYPVWMKFHGGKGVATTNMAIFLFSPLWGAVANILGMLIVFGTQYLCVGGVCIPLIFTVAVWLTEGTEAGVLGLILTVIMFTRHWPALKLIPSGQCEKTDVIGAIRRKWTRNK